jgi:hypothetical protein
LVSRWYEGGFPTRKMLTPPDRYRVNIRLRQND